MGLLQLLPLISVDRLFQEAAAKERAANYNAQFSMYYQRLNESPCVERRSVVLWKAFTDLHQPKSLRRTEANVRQDFPRRSSVKTALDLAIKGQSQRYLLIVAIKP